jgi:hypothetical protein
LTFAPLDPLDLLDPVLEKSSSEKYRLWSSQGRKNKNDPMARCYGTHL